MLLDALLPRPLDPHGDAECPVLLGSLLTGIHLDRREARRLGWRGIRPSATGAPAWTCRIVGSASVYGMLFLGEEEDGASLCGDFALCLFPKPDDPLLDAFPMAALRTALSPDYAALARELSRHAEESGAFTLGRLRLAAGLSGESLALALEARAKLRIRSGDGIAAANGEWVVAPGTPETDLCCFRLLLRLFATLTASAEALLQTAPEFRIAHVPVPGLLHSRAEGLVEDCEHTEHMVRLSAAFGDMAELPEAFRTGRALNVLPLRPKAAAPGTGRKPVLHILTGFLGAGKTTFLKQWLDFLHNRERYTGVIQNEFGKIALDAALLRDDTLVEALDEGCVCCTLADSLRPGILRLLEAMPTEQIILETTGLANPANVLEYLDGLEDLVAPGLVVTVVDACDLGHDGRDFELDALRLEQIERADALIVNKADTVSEADMADLMRRLRKANPLALILPAVHGNASFAALDALYAAWLDRTQPALPSRRPALGRMAATHASAGFVSTTVVFTSAVTRRDVEMLITDAGSGLSRAKGIADIVGEGLRIIQYAALRLDFEEPPPGADDGERYLVLIGTRLQDPVLERRG
jgi:G3E family GTPase